MKLRAVAASAALACAFSLAAGCADFEHLNNSPFQDAFQGTMGGGKKPPPDPQQPPPNQDQQNPGDRKPGPCVDLDPAVIATCIKVTGGIAPVPGVEAVLVAERSTGNILLAKRGPSQKASLVTHVDVNGAGDGGLMDIALSPNFATDGAIFAYISTPSDNRVVRLTKETGAKDVLVGVPHAGSGNYGSIQFGPGGALYVLTGNAGDAASADDPNSLAGKILRVEPDQLGGGAVDPKVIVSGLGAGGALCFDIDDPNSTLWYTNRSAEKDELLRLPKGANSPQLVWSWPERPGVSGCAVKKTVAFVALHDKLFTLVMPAGASGLPTPPVVAVDGKYGVLGDVSASPSGMLCFGTVNRGPDGKPDENVDDRVVCSAGGGGGGKGGIPGFGQPPKPKDD